MKRILILGSFAFLLILMSPAQVRLCQLDAYAELCTEVESMPLLLSNSDASSMLYGAALPFLGAIVLLTSPQATLALAALPRLRLTGRPDTPPPRLPFA